MHRRLIIFVACACVVIPAGAIVLGAFNTKSRQPVRLARVDGVTMYVPASIPDTKGGSAGVANTSIGRPCAEVSERECNFGVVEPMCAHRHRFAIRNAGNCATKDFEAWHELQMRQGRRVR